MSIKQENTRINIFKKCVFININYKWACDVCTCSAH